MSRVITTIVLDEQIFKEAHKLVGYEGVKSFSGLIEKLLREKLDSN
jgi:predicted CopG family antitoxin